ncbi:restriction endonuclease [Brucella intermedia]|uniref:restriction endonuclease n=1 Tax=Brucella intermedia TaxID=94625 RepID=UPI0018A8C603|nr:MULTISPECIES: restriction endonuclease [Brucella/Ochrobactrum group]
MSKITINSRHLKSVRVGKLQAKYSADGSRVLRYYIDFWHDGLSVHKDLSAPELYLLQGKVDALIASWDKKYDIQLAKSQVLVGKDAAEAATIDAQNRLDQLGSILNHTLQVDDRIEWETLKNKGTYQRKPFSVRKPRLIPIEGPIERHPEISLWDRIFGRAKKKLAASAESHRRALEGWRSQIAENEARHQTSIQQWEAAKASFEAAESRLEASFEADKAEHNSKVDALSAGVALGEPNSVIEHASLVLERSDYANLFEKSFQLEYQPDGKVLLLEYALPSPDEMPTLKQVRFIASTGEMKETHISDREKKTSFDLVCYQICLRTIHELFEADVAGNIQQLLFNGTTSYIDRSTGQDVTACIMSVLVDRDRFMSIDLSRIEPKACFKSLKGVSGASLSSLAAIPPVIELNKEDRRFVDGRATIDAIDNATNLAAMDWSDFEHLVRELFEKEFASRGGEVKVTQSSSDGGVDAVAFDPDPITGGKIVIQAKRYTRTVGVSAVRDLYGTMQHEGASRGVLITTADYGPDAYKFSSGKPITLFTGSNLLHLLEKHGYNVKINLKEAREASRT